MAYQHVPPFNDSRNNNIMVAPFMYVTPLYVCDWKTLEKFSTRLIVLEFSQVQYMGANKVKCIMPTEFIGSCFQRKLIARKPHHNHHTG